MNKPLTTTRKEFLQRITGTLPKVGNAPSTQINMQVDEKIPSGITEEQRDFLLVYEQWLTHFQVFIERQKKNPDDLQNNIKLMSLSQQAAEWKLQLEDFMEDELFRKTYLGIIQKITRAIG